MLPVGASLGASVSGLTAGTRYFFAATAVNSVGEGGFSNEVNVVAQEPATQLRIRDAFARRLEAEGGTVRVSAKLGSGRKP